jgi:hypothetical protein
VVAKPYTVENLQEALHRVLQSGDAQKRVEA